LILLCNGKTAIKTKCQNKLQKNKERQYKQKKKQVQKKDAAKPTAPGAFVFRKVTRSRRLGSGGVQKKTSALGRLVRWPKYVKLQRQRKILLDRLKIPPALNVFNQACGKPMAKELLSLFRRYTPETDKQKRDRNRSFAKLKAEGKPIPDEKPIHVKYGFNHVTNLIESGNAKLVLIAHDVDPIELVLWMPVLCVKKNVPFCIVKSKARLGTLVHKKTAACVALCDVSPEDTKQFESCQRKCLKRFNSNLAFMKRKWGNRTLGIKTRHKIATRVKRRKEEAERRRQAQEAKKNAVGKK